MAEKLLIGIVLGAVSDWDIMKESAQICKDFGIAYEARILTAHQTSSELEEWIEEMEARGCQAFIVGASESGHLAGSVATMTILPTFGVPISGQYLNGLDALLTTVQMPKGVPVATLAIGEVGAVNAGLSVVAVLALNDEQLRTKLIAYRARQAQKVRNSKVPKLS